MSLISYCKSEVMLVVNMVLENRGRKGSIEQFINLVSENPSLSAIRSRSAWIDPVEYYSYAGTGSESRSKMGSVIFWKKATEPSKTKDSVVDVRTS